MSGNKLRGGLSRAALLVAAFLLVASLASCGGAADAGKSSATPPASTEEGNSRPPRGKIACRLHSCAPPYFCNEESGVCEMLPCNASKDCPFDYKCDFSIGACR